MNKETPEEYDAWELAKKIFKEIRGYEPNIQEDRLDEGSVCLLERGIIEGIKWQAEQENNKYNAEEVFRLTLDALDLGMTIRQDQLKGYSEKSGKELHKEWFDQSKK